MWLGSAVEYKYAGSRINLCYCTRLSRFAESKVIPTLGHLPAPTLQLLLVKVTSVVGINCHPQVVLVSRITAHGLINVQPCKVAPDMCLVFSVPPHHT